MSARSLATPSGALAVGTTTLFNGKMSLNSVIVATDGTNAATVTVYDNTAASGKILTILSVGGTAFSGAQIFNAALRAEIGITVVVAGTGATAYVAIGSA